MSSSSSSSNSSLQGGICHDAAFGPAVASSACRGGFDFTVLFEDSIMSIVPSALFLLTAPILAARFFSRKRAIAVRPSLLYSLKLASISLYAALQLALLILWSSRSYFTTQASVASSVLGLCAALGLAVVSSLEHRRSPRPSSFLASYLLVSLFLDATRTRTSWLLQANGAVAAIQTASVAAKLLILILEAVDKRFILVGAYSRLSREATSGIFSRGFFWWLNSLLVDGSKRILNVDDLFSINEKLASVKLARDLQTQWKKYQTGHGPAQKHGLAMATLRAWRSEVVKIALPRLCLVAFNLAQPFLIQEIVATLSAPDDEETRNHGYGLIGAVALVYTGSALSTGFYQHLSFRLMTMVRGGLISLIYEKVADSPSTNARDSAAMSLIGTDVESICESWYLVTSESLPSAIQLVISVWLLQRQLGAVCIAPVVLALVSTAVSVNAAAFITGRQKVWLEAIQARINFTAHVLGSMKSIKMLGLTEKFQSAIQSMRIKELELSKRFRRLSSFNVCLMNLPSIFSQLLTFAAFAISAKIQGGSSFSVSQTVTSLSILTLLMDPLAQVLNAIPKGYAALGCFQRIQEFLSSETWKDRRLDYTENESVDNSSPSDSIELAPLPRSDSDRIVIQDATIGWRSSAPVLKNITMRVSRNTQFTVILGPVGCGKSTLLKALLGEAPIFDGTVWVKNKQVSFCDQNAWVFNGSVRDNIVGESKFDGGWYDSVMHACALDVDLTQLPYGDATNVGSKGVALSGGQKQRLAIARALYSRKPMAVFDDVLSALDAVTQELVATRVFGSQGLLRKLGTTTILATHAVNRLEFADQVVILDNKGNTVSQGRVDRLELLESFQQLAGEDGTQSGQSSEHQPAQSRAVEPKLQEQRQTGDLTVYKYYFLSLGWMGVAVFAVFVVSNSFFDTMQYAWLNLWSESNDKGQDSRLGYWLGLFTLFCVFRAAAMIAAVYYMYVVIVPKSGKHLHWAILQAAMRAPMAYLSATDTGVLVNRFSQDMKLIDMTLPAALVNTFFQLAGCLGVAALAIVAIPYMAAVLPFIVAVLWFLQRFYLRTSRQLRLLDLEAKAPLYSHVLESINGMTSIRAFGWQERHADKNFRLLDAAQKPFYLLLCIQRWLVLVLGLIVAGLATLLTVLAIVLRAKVNPGFLGIALVNMLSFGETLASLVTFWTSLETSLGAISRVKSFSEDTPSEITETETETPTPEWPTRGSLKFENWSAHYIGLPVLYCINMSVSPGEKVAICGRTGSGKSSLISSVLGMINGSSGRIVMDGLDLATIPKDVIRQKITCLTQEPFLFGGSVRLNADPLGEATDAEVVAALEKVSLWAVIKQGAADEGLPKDGALDLVVADDGKLFSSGQQQLFCLARALLRKRRVLLLDEPTSSVDTTTESCMRAIIESEFSEATVIMVTHRLSGILNFDKVAVLDAGVLVEYGSPRELLAESDSAFAKLYSTQQGVSRQDC